LALALAGASSITALTAANFNTTADAASVLVVTFHAPWCGHCKTFLPELETAHATLQDEDLDAAAVLCTVDAVAEPALYEQYAIKGFPTIKIIKYGVDVGDFDGERKAAAVVDFVQEVQKETTTEWLALATVEEATKARADAGDQPLVVGYFDSLEGGAARAFTRSALFCSQNWVQFLATDSAEVAADFGLAATGTAALVKVYDDKRHEMDAALLADPKAAADFVILRAYPLLIEFSKNNHELLFTPRPGYKNHVIFFVDPAQPYWSLPADATQATETTAIRAAAEVFRGQALFMWIDATHPANEKLCKQMKAPFVLKGSGDADGFGYELADPVARLVMSDSAAGRMRRFAYEQGQGVVTQASLEGWLAAAFAGAEKEDPSLEMKDVELTATESENAEKALAAAVDKVVPELHPAALGKLLADPARADGLMLAFHAPWCGHCKKLLPEYAKAAQLLAAQKAPVLLSKMDATDEGNGGTAKAHGADGFPTLKFFPPTALTDLPPGADAKQAEAHAMATAVKYSGERSADALVNFTVQQLSPALTEVRDSAAIKAFATGAMTGERPMALLLAFLPEGGQGGAAHRVMKKAAALVRAKGGEAQVAAPAVCFDKPLAEAYLERAGASGAAGGVAAMIIRPFGGEKAYEALPAPLMSAEAAAAWTGGSEEDKAAQAISDWLETNARPAMIAFSPATKKLVDASAVKVQLLVLVNETTLYAKQGRHKGLREALVAVGQQFRGQMLVVYVDCDWVLDGATGERTGKRKNAGVMDFFGVDQTTSTSTEGGEGGEGVPAVRLVDMRKAAMKQYALEDNREALKLQVGEGDGRGEHGAPEWQAGLSALAQAFFDGDAKGQAQTLTRRLKSADKGGGSAAEGGGGGDVEGAQEAAAAPGEDGALAVSAAQLTAELGKGPAEARSVLLEVHAPWCGHCKKLQPEYEALAKLFRPSADKLLVAKMDGTVNELDGMDVDGFPHIVLFKPPLVAGGGGETAAGRAAQRVEAATAYDGGRDLAGLSAFLYEHVHGLEGGGLGEDYPGGREEL
jgi:protein disulfide-isomerase A1